MTAVAKNALSSTSSKSNAPSMLLKFKRKDSPLGVQKATVKQMANLLGFNETDVVHYALSKLAREIIPAYELDDGALSESEINKIRKLSGVDQGMLMTNALFA